MNSDALRAVTLGLCLVPLPGWVQGAELPRADEAADYLAPSSLVEAHPRWTREHAREGAILADFLVWPAATLGTVIDSNPFQLHRPRRAVVGLAFAPSVLVERESGVHRTLGYGAGDIRVFPGESGADTLHGRAGVLHDWAIQRDLNVRMQADVDRRTDPFNNTQLVAASGTKGLLERTTALGTLSVQKTFSRAFVVVSTSVLRSGFEVDGVSKAGLGRTLSDETVVTTKARIGAWLAPALFAFAEPAANWRSLDLVSRPSSGARAVAGVGVARFGLLSGEIFAGGQVQDYPLPRRTVSTPVVGGRVSWSPTRAWTVTAECDESLGDVAVATAVDPLGTPVRDTAATLNVDYALTPIWSARATLGAIWLDYVGTSRHDRLTLADLQVDYAVSRSFALSGALRFASLHSSFEPAAYGRTVATLGATYHY